MSDKGYTSGTPLYETVFIEDELEDVLQDVIDWLKTSCDIKIRSQIIHRNNAFYFSDITLSFDSEIGYRAGVYHSEIIKGD